MAPDRSVFHRERIASPKRMPFTSVIHSVSANETRTSRIPASRMSGTAAYFQRVFRSESRFAARKSRNPAQHAQKGSGTVSYTGNGLPVTAYEKQRIEELIKLYKGNLSAVAAELGIARTTLYRRMKKYGIRQ